MSSLRCAILVFVLAVVWWTYPFAQAPRPAELGSLKTVSVPAPAGIDVYALDTRLLVVLGKALFWDMQVGSDSRTACASCHFHAGPIIAARMCWLRLPMSRATFL
jgi:cytochrome c peroxidase